MEDKFAAHNYHPIPVVFERAEGVHVWDPEGKKYYDFLSAYSAVNQGHCHPALLKAMTDQAQKLTLSSRAFHNSVFPLFAEHITKLFKYDSVLPMNTGAEAVETAIKTARKWGYYKKGIPKDQAIIISCENNFHGRTLGIVSMSTDPDARDGYGPFLPGFRIVPFGDIKALENVLNECGERVCGFLMEPIQGEAGIIIPPDGFLTQASKLCKKHNVLFIADEVQCGLARTGKMLASDWEPCRPDIVVLGKALGGGLLPVSCILADYHVMDVYKPGTHGSTFGGNPLSSAVAMASLRVLTEENLAENAQKLGTIFRDRLEKVQEKHKFITAIRGKGLFNAIDLDEKYPKKAWDLCIEFANRGLLAKPTHEHIIRLAPPLTMTQDQLEDCIEIITDSIEAFAKK